MECDMERAAVSVGSISSVGVCLGCCMPPWMKEWSPRQRH